LKKKNETVGDDEKATLREEILNFKGSSVSSFGDALEWQKNERKDRYLPFNEL
jgi:hypothetical protein